MRVVADGRCRLPYATYVLQGLLDLGHDVRFGRLDAPGGDGLALRVGSARVWVDTNDHASFDEEAYSWADVVGKVNCGTEDAAIRSKVCLLGPLFGIRLWPLPGGYLRLPGLVASGRSPRSALADVRFQGKTRLALDAYMRRAAEPGFVFHGSRAWSGKHDGTNAQREMFLQAVRQSGIANEIWFSDQRIPLSEYVAKTRLSTLVFNSPAVHACLGWKLGEYLALGKAIISTELSRALPAPLEHGEAVHYTPVDVDSMAGAIELINGDAVYRRRLELGAASWFDQHMAPAAVARRLVGRVVG